jgi:DNA invertase Pin-like site-specific DNA recombinase
LKCSACSLSSKTNLRRERQLEGIATAKAAGVYKGRPPTIDPSEVLRLKNEGLGASKIAKRLQIGRASVYRVVADAKGNTRLARTAPMVR